MHCYIFYYSPLYFLVPDCCWHAILASVICTEIVLLSSILHGASQYLCTCSRCGTPSYTVQLLACIYYGSDLVMNRWSTIEGREYQLPLGIRQNVSPLTTRSKMIMYDTCRHVHTYHVILLHFLYTSLYIPGCCGNMVLIKLLFLLK